MINRLKKQMTHRLLLNTQFENAGKHMVSEFESLKKNREVNPSDEGKTLENLLKDIFQKYLPFQFGVERGYLTNVDGVVSKERDIIIYDKIHSVIFRDEGDYIIIPVESAFATIEVKSTLTKQIIDAAASNIESIQTLKRYVRLDDKNIVVEIKDIGRPILNALFAFESKIALKTVCRHLYTHRSIIDCACVLFLSNIFYATPHKEKQDIVRFDAKPTKSEKGDVRAERA